VFFEPTQNANPAITTYYYAVNGGAFVNAQRATSPITVSGLTTAGTYSVVLFGASAFGNTQVSNAVSGEPWIVGTEPHITTLTPYLQGVSVAFAPSMGGHPPPQTYYYSVDGGATYVDAQTTASPVAIGNLVVAAPYAFTLKAYNDTVGFTGNAAVKTATPWIVGAAPVVANVASAVNALVVSFVGSTGGNPAPTTYAYTLDGGATYVDLNSTVSPFTIGNLTTVGPRTVQLVATNAAGTTAPSNAVSGQPFVRGDRPVITRIESAYQRLSIEFDASGYNGYPPLTTYFYSLDDGATYTNAQTTQSPIAVPNLFLPVACTVRLMGYNAAVGNTEPSLAVVATPYIIGSAPNEVSVTPALASLVIEIDPATDGYPAAYTFAYSLDGVVYTDLQSNSTTITVPQLTELRPYTVSIVAINNAGTSSPLVVQGTPYQVGSAPTVQSVQDVPNGIVVQFAPSAGANPPPTTYYYSLNGGATYVDGHTAASPLVVTGLLPAPYAFRMKGFSAVTGFTPASSPAVAGNVSGVGSAPVITSIAGVQNGLIVNFQPSVGGNPPPTTYYYSLDGGDFVDGHVPGSPLIITGLNVIKSYAVQVFAASEIGNTAASAVEYGMPFLVGGPPSITGLVVDDNARTLTVNFLESGGNPPPVAYQYSLDAGSTYVDGHTAHSPIVIADIDLFGSYTVVVRAIYASPPSQSASWTSNRVEPAPLVLSVTADFNVLTVALQRPDPAHYPALEAYYYSTDGGATYTSAGTNQSPITVAGLDSGTTYAVLIRGKNVFGLYTEAAAVTSTTRSVANFFVNAMNPAGNRRRPIFVGPQPKFTVLPTGNNNNAKNTSQKYSDYVNGPHATRR
jgi:titin